MSVPDDATLQRQIQMDLQEIRFLARQITTPAEFDRILAGIQDPFYAREVRTLIAPLLPFPVDGLSES